MVLDRALSGEFPIQLWAENLSDQPIVLCRPVDGSMAADRDPAYLFRLRDGKGREVPRSKGEGCPWQNNLQDRDFVTLRPKQKVELLKSAGAFGTLTSYQFEGLKPGDYTLTLTYVMTGEGKVGGKPAGAFGPNVQALLRKALRGEVTSNAVKLRLLPAPGTEALLKLIAGEGEKVLSPADALLVLGYRRDPRGYEPTLAALSDKDPEVRWAAAFSLRHYAAAYSVGQLKDKDIIPPGLLKALTQSTHDSDQRVGEIAAVSLRFARECLEAARAKK
jgi:hypothetical protein